LAVLGPVLLDFILELFIDISIATDAVVQDLINALQGFQFR
jgi:hypothetical protein